jgi:hypothetical protein
LIEFMTDELLSKIVQLAADVKTIDLIGIFGTTGAKVDRGGWALPIKRCDRVATRAYWRAKNGVLGPGLAVGNMSGSIEPHCAAMSLRPLEQSSADPLTARFVE